MVCRGGKAPWKIAQRVDRHLLAVVEDLQHPFRGADPHFLANQRVRNTVIMSFEGDVVIDVHPGIFPASKFIGTFRQRQQCRLVQFFEQFSARSFQDAASLSR